MELDGGDSMELDEAAAGRARGASGGGGSAGNDVDRLSALPDSLLHAIMSFLKARQAVQTCVLATRWRNLWRSVPCLDIDQDEFRAVPPKRSDNHPAPPPAGANNFVDSDGEEEVYEDSEEEADDDDGGGTKDKEWESFEDFADCLMHHCNIAQLDSLSLRVSKSRAPSFADKQAGGWLRRAMKYCTTDPAHQRGGMGSNTWRLRRLYLRNVALDCRFTMHVSAVCLSLEDLELEDCVCAIHQITSNSLKSLVLKNCRWNYLSVIASPTLKSLAIAGGSNSSDCVLVIRAPAIAHLSLDVPLRFAKRVAVN